MKKILFIVSHLGSDSESLCKALDNNPRVQVYNTGTVYDHPDVGVRLVSLEHKNDTTAAYWAEELLHNHRFCHRSFYQWARFIYLVRDARTLHALRPTSAGEAAVNLRYYLYRLRRICEMAHFTPGAVLLTWNDLQKPLTVVEDYLTLRKSLEKVEVGVATPSPFVTPEQVREGQKAYEWYFYYLRNQKLLRPNSITT